MKTYKIKLEDKAAFINRLDKQGVGVESYEIKDDKLKGLFEFNINDPVIENIVKTILKQSPKINQLKEMSLTKSQLAKIIREELSSMKKSKKKELDEVNMDILGPALGVTVPALSVVAASLGANIPSVKNQLAMKKGISPEEVSTMDAIKAIASTLAGKMQKEYGGE
jgi:hypothetical protein